MLVVGGGINGAGIARDMAGRGLSVVLCEKDDLAAHTSSSSTKLVHGGLRYLEHYEFLLVRKALQEREVLLRSAPHIMRPMRFVMPHDSAMRPAWLIRLGMILYDRLARREILPASEAIALREHEAGAPLRAGYSKGFVYSDICVDDARLVVLNAMDAAERGAMILTRTRCTHARRTPEGWIAELHGEDGRHHEVRASVLVNSAGPWAEQFLREQSLQTGTRSLRLVKGSHIVVRKLFEHPFAYIFQSPDKRVIFAIPYERDFTLIGTTDVEFEGDPAGVSISAVETEYLCTMVNRYFGRQISAPDVVWSYSGVRPLLEDEAADVSTVTRDYALELDGGPGRAPLLCVFGGKITTYRRLAEEVWQLLAPHLGVQRPAWTAKATLPGGDIPNADFNAFLASLQRDYPWLPPDLLHRYARAYGTRIHRLLRAATKLTDLGRDFGDGIFAAEIDYLVKYEWARTVEDILWRRSKMGLYVTAQAPLAAALPGIVGQHHHSEVRHATRA